MQIIYIYIFTSVFIYIRVKISKNTTEPYLKSYYANKQHYQTQTSEA